MNEFVQVVLGLFIVLAIPLGVSLLPWRKNMLGISNIKYVVGLTYSFLTGAVPVFLVEWTPNNLHSWLDVVLAGLAAAGMYHVPSPLQAARKRLSAPKATL